MPTRRDFLGGASAAGAVTLLSGPPPASAADGAGGAAGAGPAGAEQRARDAMRAANAGMRSHYAALKSALMSRLSPVVVVQNDAKGGRFTLVHDGRQQESVHPVSEVFELAKAISHVPQGIFSIIAPCLSGLVPRLPNADRIDPHDLGTVAFEGSRSQGWTGPLRDYADTLTDARRQLGAAGLPRELEASCGELLDQALRFIGDCVGGGTPDAESFADFTGRTYPSIRTNMTYAAAAQISGVEGLMRRWRGRIGEAAWDDLYTVVLSIWTTSELNQASVVIRRCMNPARVATRLIDLPTAEVPHDPVLVALDNLARIVQDNVAAELVFPTDPVTADAFKGKQDLVSGEILRQLGGPEAAHTLPDVPGVSACPVRRGKVRP